MSDLWTPNQAPAPCRCVKYNPAPEPGKCGTCGGRLPEKIGGESPEYLMPTGYMPKLSELLAAKIGSIPPLNLPDISQAVFQSIRRGDMYTRVNADAVRNQGGQERGLIG